MGVHSAHNFGSVGGQVDDEITAPPRPFRVQSPVPEKVYSMRLRVSGGCRKHAHPGQWQSTISYVALRNLPSDFSSRFRDPLSGSCPSRAVASHRAAEYPGARGILTDIRKMPSTAPAGPLKAG